MGPTLSGRFKEVVGLGSYNGVIWAMVRDRNKTIDIGGGRLKRFYCVYIVIIYIYTHAIIQ